jgi:hypothetical protein
LFVVYSISVLLEKLRGMWLDNIETALVGIVWSGVDWIGLAPDWYKWRALVNAVMIVWVP